jgi:actin-binding protein anillin
VPSVVFLPPRFLKLISYQGILERAEKRSKALGISSVNIPLSEFNSDSTASSSSRSPRKPAASPRRLVESPSKQTTRIVSNFAASETNSDDDSKENCDLAVEISITTGKNVELDVQVAECEIDEDGNITKQVNKTKSIDVDAVMESRSLIRDTSRNRLQRLGTLYSDNQDLSSPIHRTEGKFHETLAEKSEAIQKRKFGKLAALAQTINNWEDDPSHPDYKHHRETIYDNKSPTKVSPTKPKGSSPKCLGATPKQKSVAPEPPKSILLAERTQPDSTTKQLKWDRKIMDSLESQGFKKRESNVTKLSYDYSAEDKDNASNKAIEQEPKGSPKKVQSPRAPVVVPKAAPVVTKAPEPKKESPKKAEAPGRSGLVSGRAAIFEQSRQISPSKNSKDPTELSLKVRLPKVVIFRTEVDNFLFQDRMAIFEKNKGTAPVPKAPFGMAPSTKQIQQDRPMAAAARKPVTKPVAKPTVTPKSPQQQLIANFNQPVVAESKAAGLAIQKTMEALKSGGATISEALIAEENRRQRQQEMNVLMNRFKAVENSPIPTAPPPPPAIFFDTQRRQSHIEAVVSHKRRSDERNLDEADHPQVSPEVRSTLDDVKRIRVTAPKQGHLYPALSDIESTTGSETEYTTASATEESEMREYRFHEPRQPAPANRRAAEQYSEDEQSDRWVTFLIDLLLFCFCVN